MTNLEIVQCMYAAFGERDRDTILELFDPQIEWVQNEGFPGGGRHFGAEAVLNDVFAKFRQEWEVWQAGFGAVPWLSTARMGLGSIGEAEPVKGSRLASSRTD